MTIFYPKKAKTFLQILLFSCSLVFSTNLMAGKLAIVIDDIGYRPKEDSQIYALPKEINVAIIPAAPYATSRAQQAFAEKRDILIHLPMQPSKPVPIEAGALTIGMSEDKISHLIETSKVKVPYAIGLNNHMGSGATADKATMQALMKTLAAEKLFFLDSKTIGKSVALSTAKEFGVKALERHFFLDDSDALSDVQRQFQLAVQHAKTHDVTVLIGHPRKNSIEVLKQGLAHLPKDVELVHIGSLWRNEKVEPAQPFILLFGFEPAPTSQAPFNDVPLLRGVPKD